jgi:hypothetical protein
VDLRTQAAIASQRAEEAEAEAAKAEGEIEALHRGPAADPQGRNPRRRSRGEYGHARRSSAGMFTLAGAAPQNVPYGTFADGIDCRRAGSSNRYFPSENFTPAIGAVRMPASQYPCVFTAVASAVWLKTYINIILPCHGNIFALHSCAWARGNNTFECSKTQPL